MLEFETIDEIYAAYGQYLRGNNSSWDKIKHTCIKLPNWYDHSLHADSDEYKQQQYKLWKQVVDVTREYNAELDEQVLNCPHTDVIRFPAGFINRDENAVNFQGDHFIATGMFMKYSGIKPGQNVLEYGPGFGGIALQMARLGVNVDTVDISDYFVDTIKEQSDFYKVPLTSFKGEFGFNPRGDMKYDLIFFYESFHHCLEFKKVIKLLKEYLAYDGKIMMAGEPIVETTNSSIPSAWGIRMDTENIAIMRYRHWFELGFTEDYLISNFVNAGFIAQKMRCDVSTYGRGYIFKHRPDTIHMSNYWLSHDEANSWNAPESTGRWTTDMSYLSIDTSDTFNKISVCMTNHHPLSQTVIIEYGSHKHSFNFSPHECKTISLDATVKARSLSFESSAIIPNNVYKSTDTRSLGIFVNTFSYIK